MMYVAVPMYSNHPFYLYIIIVGCWICWKIRGRYLR